MSKYSWHNFFTPGWLGQSDVDCALKSALSYQLMWKDINTKSELSIGELQRLLVGLKEHRRDTCFRYRLVGELWHPSFMRIVSVTDTSVLLLNEQSDRLISVNTSLILQFEIDIGYQEYLPNFHYTVNHRK